MIRRPPRSTLFPTRRSSDLLKEESRLNAKGYSTRDERRLLDALGRGLLKDFPNPGRSGCPGPDVLKRIADRKSTRLNSSHLVISYAVFCLKKKQDTSEHSSI